LNENKETLDSLGSLVVSNLELSVTPTDGIQDLIVGNWAVLKVTPVEPEFFNDFKLSRFNLFKGKFSIQIGYQILHSIKCQRNKKSDSD